MIFVDVTNRSGICSSQHASHEELLKHCLYSIVVFIKIYGANTGSLQRPLEQHLDLYITYIIHSVLTCILEIYTVLN